MPLKYEIYPLREMDFRNLYKIQAVIWNYKSLIVKSFDSNTLKLKAANPKKVVKNKKQCF